MQPMQNDDLYNAIEGLLDKKKAPLNTLRNIIIWALLGAGAGSLWGAWYLDGKSSLWSGVLANLGCEFIGSLLILAALDYVEKRRNADALIDKQILNHIQRISQEKIVVPRNLSAVQHGNSQSGYNDSSPPPELTTRNPRTR